MTQMMEAPQRRYVLNAASTLVSGWGYGAITGEPRGFAPDAANGKSLTNRKGK